MRGLALVAGLAAALEHPAGRKVLLSAPDSLAMFRNDPWPSKHNKSFPPKQTKLYSPNGAREVARRLRQMQKVAT